MKHSRKIHILLLIFTVLVLSVKLSFAVDAPTSFHATAINENQINLDWILNAGNDSILLVFNTTDTFDIPVDGICYDTGYVFPSGAKVLFKDTSTSFSHTGLTDNTVYYYKIWSFSAGCFYSIGVIDSAQTYCQKIGGTSEGFENNGNIPDCWRQEYVMGTDDWVFTYGNTTTNNPNAPYAGNYCAVLNGSNVKTKLILPKFDFDTVTTGITLSLRVFTTANSSLKIYYKTSDTTSWILFHTISASENWANYVYQMPDLSGNYTSLGDKLRFIK